MKSFNKILITSLLTLSAFGSVTYMACKKDRCNNVACLNGGSCDNGNCVCTPGFEGNRCETLSRTKFITNFNGGDSCSYPTDSLGLHNYGVKFLTIANNPTTMTMRNFLGNPDDSATCYLQSPDSFIFNGANNSVTYRGYGKISNDSLYMKYHVQYDTIPFDCHYLGLRY